MITPSRHFALTMAAALAVGACGGSGLRGSGGPSVIRSPTRVDLQARILTVAGGFLRTSQVCLNTSGSACTHLRVFYRTAESPDSAYADLKRGQAPLIVGFSSINCKETNTAKRVRFCVLSFRLRAQPSVVVVEYLREARGGTVMQVDLTAGEPTS